MTVFDAHGRPTYGKPFDQMGREAQMNVLKQGIGHLMMGQVMMMEGLTARTRRERHEWQEKARRWIDSTTGRGAGDKAKSTGTAPEPEQPVGSGVGNAARTGKVGG
jgi:hypothetical protein